MFNLVYVNTENHLKKLVRDQKKEGRPLNVLFISKWDDVCDNLMEILEAKNLNMSGAPDLHIVNSFDTPHSFVIWENYKVPGLVQVRTKDKRTQVRKTENVTDIYKRLKLER